MHESTLVVRSSESLTQPQPDDVSLIRAALFGVIVPSSLATVAFILVQVGNFSLFSSPFSFLFTFLWITLYLSFFCAPFGVPFALLCGMLAGTWLRQGKSLVDVQARLASVGATCGLVALWGVAILMGRLFDGKWTVVFVPQWPAAFWGAALVVGGICGWLLPRVARPRRSGVSLTA